jgi:hypothetical protein
MSIVKKYAFSSCTTTPAEENKVTVKGPCYSCKKELSVTVPQDDLAKFRKGVFAQDCFPYLSAADREFLISGICDDCWNEMFPVENEDDDDDY